MSGRVLGFAFFCMTAVLVLGAILIAPRDQQDQQQEDREDDSDETMSSTPTVVLHGRQMQQDERQSHGFFSRFRYQPQQARGQGLHQRSRQDVQGWIGSLEFSADIEPVLTHMRRRRHNIEATVDLEAARQVLHQEQLLRSLQRRAHTNIPARFAYNRAIWDLGGETQEFRPRGGVDLLPIRRRYESQVPMNSADRRNRLVFMPASVEMLPQPQQGDQDEESEAADRDWEVVSRSG